MDPIIEVKNLRKQYGDHVAVEDVSFDVRPGEIFGIIGPNGAGKTTTVESLIGLRVPDSGSVRVLGYDPQKEGIELRKRLGVQLQEADLQDRMKVWEALDLFQSFYDDTADPEQLLKDWDLVEKRKTAFSNLSGGQKQRLFIALSLINKPEVVILDELTTGLDPQARRATWDLVRAIRDGGTTVILVTHFMDEAEELADRVAMIDNGRIIALDTPEELIAQHGGGLRVRFTTQNGFDPQTLTELAEVSHVEQQGSDVTVYGEGALMARVAVMLADKGVVTKDLRTDQSTLEDVFIKLANGDH